MLVRAGVNTITPLGLDNDEYLTPCAKSPYSVRTWDSNFGVPQEGSNGRKKEGCKEARKESRRQEEEGQEVVDLTPAGPALFLEERRRTVERPLKRVVVRLQRTLDNVNADIARTNDADLWRHRGELLASQLARVERGTATVLLRDFSAEGAPLISVPLDPKLSPKENLERCFRLYRKQAGGRPRAVARLAEVERDLISARALLAQVATADALTLEQIAEQTAALIGPKAIQQNRKRDEPRLPYRVFVSSTGHRILLGRSAKDNDALTFRHARGRDAWLHARGATGAHVVVPASEGPPDEITLREAALLALHFSAARNVDAAEVSITTQRHVRRVKTAGAGAVTYSQERTIWVTNDAARLAVLRRSER